MLKPIYKSLQYWDHYCFSSPTELLKALVEILEDKEVSREDLTLDVSRDGTFTLRVLTGVCAQ